MNSTPNKFKFRLPNMAHMCVRLCTFAHKRTVRQARNGCANAFHFTRAHRYTSYSSKPYISTINWALTQGTILSIKAQQLVDLYSLTWSGACSLLNIDEIDRYFSLGRYWDRKLWSQIEMLSRNVARLSWLWTCSRS